MTGCAANPRQPLLLVFARAPRMGAAKTRLARDIGRVKAWRVNRIMNARALREAQRGAQDAERWRAVLCVAKASDLPLNLPGVWPRTIMRADQGIGDLGARLSRAFQRSRAPMTLAIGTDAPDMRRADIAAAIKALGSSDAVFGPAADGGFWLIGLKRRLARRLDLSGVRWSTAHALADARARLPSNARVALLRALIDVDDGESWRTVRRANEVGRLI